MMRAVILLAAFLVITALPPAIGILVAYVVGGQFAVPVGVVAWIFCSVAVWTIVGSGPK